MHDHEVAEHSMHVMTKRSRHGVAEDDMHGMTKHIVHKVEAEHSMHDVVRAQRA